MAVFGWVIFQLDSLREAGSYYAAMLGLGGAGFSSLTDLYYLRSFLLILLAAVIAATPTLRKLYGRLPSRVRSVLTPFLVLLALTLCTAYLVDSTYNPFLYFRF